MPNGLWHWVDEKWTTFSQWMAFNWYPWIVIWCIYHHELVTTFPTLSSSYVEEPKEGKGRMLSHIPISMLMCKSFQIKINGYAPCFSFHTVGLLKFIRGPLKWTTDTHNTTLCARSTHGKWYISNHTLIILLWWGIFKVLCFKHVYTG